MADKTYWQEVKERATNIPDLFLAGLGAEFLLVPIFYYDMSIFTIIVWVAVWWKIMNVIYSWLGGK